MKQEALSGYSACVVLHPPPPLFDNAHLVSFTFRKTEPGTSLLSLSFAFPYTMRCIFDIMCVRAACSYDVELVLAHSSALCESQEEARGDGGSSKVSTERKKERAWQGPGLVLSLLKRGTYVRVRERNKVGISAQ